MKNIRRMGMVAAVLLGALGCSTLKGTIGYETTDYLASICAEGAVMIPCKPLGTLSIPTGGDAFATLIVTLAGPYLAQQAKMKSCVFTTYPESVSGAIVVTATAACSLQGVPVTEKVTVTLAPVPVTT